LIEKVKKEVNARPEIVQKLQLSKHAKFEELIIPIPSQIDTGKQHPADTPKQHPADYAKRVMNITMNDMKILPPLLTWLYATPLVSFEECIADLKELEMEGKKVLANLPVFVSSVKKRVTQMMEDTKSLNLSVDERAAIYLYTMELPELPDNKMNGSVYYLMNLFLRNDNRAALKPFLKYLKLLLSALYKLPAVKDQQVCRGVKADIGSDMKSKEKQTITWNSFSSTTLNSSTLDNPMFLGTTGKRALFMIDCKSGRNISALSACPSEDEILLMPCTSFIVEHVILQKDLTIVTLREVEPLEDFVVLFVSTEKLHSS
jgi:hypothetical protein